MYEIPMRLQSEPIGLASGRKEPMPPKRLHERYRGCCTSRECATLSPKRKKIE